MVVGQHNFPKFHSTVLIIRYFPEISSCKNQFCQRPRIMNPTLLQELWEIRHRFCALHRVSPRDWASCFWSCVEWILTLKLSWVIHIHIQDWQTFLEGNPADFSTRLKAQRMLEQGSIARWKATLPKRFETIRVTLLLSIIKPFDVLYLSWSRIPCSLRKQLVD